MISTMAQGSVLLHALRTLSPGKANGWQLIPSTALTSTSGLAMAVRKDGCAEDQATDAAEAIDTHA